MLDITGSVWSRLRSDAGLQTLIATYAGNWAVVTDPVPADLRIETDRPIVIVGHPLLNEADDTFSEDIRVAELRVRLYHKPAGSSLPLDAAAEQVRSILKSWPVGGAVTGGTLIAATVSGPVVGPTDDPSLDGRILTARLIVKED